MRKEDVLIVCALEDEAQDQLGDWETLYTGVGKINATYALSKRLFSSKPKLVINYGTAGSRDLDIGDLVDCTKFLQRDMDKTALGFQKGETAFEDNIPIILDFTHVEFNPIERHYVCGTGDNFVENIQSEIKSIDVFDMEAYALAKVCYMNNLPFISYKYITDNANKEASKNWKDNLADGISVFKHKILGEIA
tara:strand:+ start:1687 stop:2265 length:579 start_codon:yes stop_codon:yes gene_type:complete